MVEVKNISKKYGDHDAVKNLSFSVKKGCVYGFLGANGAGKTTTLNILTGCLAPDEGSVKIGGFDLFENPREAKRRVGYLPEIPPLYPDMTPREYLRFVCEAKEIPKNRRREETERVIDAAGLSGTHRRLIKNLSKGYKQRVGLAAALIGEPEVLILDEPTVGLDPMQIIEIRDLVKEYGKKHTVIISSHILSEIDLICDRVLILSHGKLVAEDTPQALAGRANQKNILELTVKGSRDKLTQALERLGGDFESETEEIGGGEFRVTLSHSRNEDLRERVFFVFSEVKLPIIRMEKKSASLETVFLELSGEEKGEDRS